MKKYILIFSSMFFFISSSMVVESEEQNVNAKFKFIEDIYSESWALLIGINDYQNVDPLGYAVDDAVSVRDILKEKYGFKEENILLITDEEATKDNIMDGFQKILLQAKEKDRIVVFYAGHGATYPLPNGGDMGYLIPVDGDASKEKIFTTSISMSTMEELARMSEAKHILYLVDACYGGLTLSTRGLGQEQTPEYLRKMTKEKGRQVITAGGKDEKVMEKAEWGHSAFTKNLLSGLKNELADANNDGIISGEELGSFIKTGVNIDTDGQHIPQKGRMGSDVGEFVFISETLENKVAMVESGNEGLDEIKDQMAAQQEQMAQLTELLLAQAQSQQGTQAQEIEPPGKKIKTAPKSKKSNKSKNIKTASTLSWVFPGIGHYYSERVSKGMLFTGLELISIAAMSSFSSDASKLDEEYQFALGKMDNANNSFEYDNWKKDAARLLEEKNGKQIGMIVSGTAAIGVWIWNVRDMKKNSSKHFSSYEKRFSMGVNRYGQVEARINF